MVNMTATIRSPLSKTAVYNPTNSELHITTNNTVYFTKPTTLDTSKQHGDWYYNTERLQNTFNLNTDSSSARIRVLAPGEKQLIEQSAEYKDKLLEKQARIADTLAETTNGQYGAHATRTDLGLQHTKSLKSELWPDYSKTKQNLGIVLGNTVQTTSTYRTQCKDITNKISSP